MYVRVLKVTHSVYLVTENGSLIQAVGPNLFLQIEVQCYCYKTYGNFVLHNYLFTKRLEEMLPKMYSIKPPFVLSPYLASTSTLAREWETFPS